MTDIPVLIPDMPSADELSPWLKRMDQTRWYANFGPLCREYERSMAGFIAGGTQDVPQVLSVNSGTAALEAALMATRLPARAGVLVPALSFASTAAVPARLGLAPMFADVDPVSWTLTPEIAQAALKHAHIRAVVPVAAYGLALPEDQWDEFSERTGLAVILDAAGALGNQRPGKRCPAAFSLHATKVGGVGEGGLLAGRDQGFMQTARMLSNHGYQKWMSRRVGGNLKLSEYHAAVGLAQLKRLPRIVRRIRELAAIYANELSGLGGRVRLQPAPPGMLRSVFCVRLEGGEAEQVASGMAQQGVQTRRWYCPPLHEHPAFADFRRIGPDGGNELPVADALGEDILGLPFHTSLTDGDAHRACAALAATLSTKEDG